MENKNFKKLNIKKFILIAVSIFCVIIIVYTSNFYDHSLSDKSADWGTFGDFIGGTLNPTLAFLSLIAILNTINIQSKELSNSSRALENSEKELAKSSEALTEQSKSLKIQNFETTFFNMINLHNEIIRNIKIENNLTFTYRDIWGNKDFKKIFLMQGNMFNTEKPVSIYGKDAINHIIQEFDNFSYNHDNKARLFNNLYDLFHDAMPNTFGSLFWKYLSTS